MTTYAIGDLHFGHRNITGPKLSSWSSGYRNFDTIEDMNVNITQSINHVVGLDDRLIVVGDFAMGRRSLIPSYRESINCKNITLIIGNHDRDNLKYTWFSDLFSDIYPYYELDHDHTLFCFFHYPMKSWADCNRGAIAVTGHEHGHMPYADYERGIDIGWDVWRRPLSLDEIKYMMSKKQKRDIHHNTENKNEKICKNIR